MGLPALCVGLETLEGDAVPLTRTPGGGWENGKKHGIGPSGWEICRKVDEEIAANADESSVRGPFQIILCAQFAFRLRTS